MLRMSKAPLNAAQVRSYHEHEFVNSEQRYYSQDNTIHGEWQGKLTATLGLHGAVRDDQFYRIAEGQHPATGEQLVRHRMASEYKNQQGETVQSAEHRAGWDATFNAPKSVSITALVGGDAIVREARGTATPDEIACTRSAICVSYSVANNQRCPHSSNLKAGAPFPVQGRP